MNSQPIGILLDAKKHFRLQPIALPLSYSGLHLLSKPKTSIYKHYIPIKIMPTKPTKASTDADDSDNGIKISVSAGRKSSQSKKTGASVAGSKKLKKEKRERISVPLTLYGLAERAKEFANNKYFPDSLLSVFAFISIAIAFPFYPIIVLVVLAFAIFILSRLHPLAGLMALLLLTLPMYLYQAPLFALLYMIVLSIALVFGYKHYRTIIVAYTLLALPFSLLGYFLEVPAFVISVLYIGTKRGAIATALAIVALPVVATLTGISLSGPLVYTITTVNATSTVSQYIIAHNYVVPSLLSFPGVFAGSLQTFIDSAVYVPQAIYIGINALANSIISIAVQLVLWLVVVFAMTSHVIRSRSTFKGSQSSLFSLAVLLGYVALSYFFHSAINYYALAGFAIAPLLLLFLELNEIDVVRALDVMKKDFLGGFGEAFEDLTSGTRETLNDIGNYEHTKDEMREAILQPIEHKEIEGAYHIKPAKGVLLFGPPGTGKTLLMRALANEVRARFFYVKSSSILSPQIGASSSALSKIFDRVRIHTPAILFFDEIDGIARRRDEYAGNVDPELLSTLLSEMDGFQKIEGVVIVGSTNVPNMIDPALMRPGRFDRVVYMPLPDKAGREAIFTHYSKRYPMSSDIDLDSLAESTSRFSGADIANVCKETATHVGNEALKKSKALKITTDDLLDVIKNTKPSTTFEQLEAYDEFKTDYERRLGGEELTREDKKLSIDDVIGMEKAKSALRGAIEIPLQHPEMMKDYDLEMVSGVLMYGPPGCGKTMLMQAIADEMDKVHLIKVSGADLSKEGYDNAVKKLKEYFFRAKENAPSVMFVDEIDSLAPDRDTASELGVRLTAEFLREFDEAKKTQGVLIVGATNRPDAVEPALIRPGRLDKLIYAEPPNAVSREQLFRKYLKKSQVSPDMDYAKLGGATKGFTGADIANICREAKMQSLENTVKGSSSSNIEEKISTDEILNIIKSTTPSAPASVVGRYAAFEATHERQ